MPAADLVRRPDPGWRLAIVVLEPSQINPPSRLFPTSNARLGIRVGALGKRRFCELPPVSGHQAHDLFLGHNQSVRPFNSIDLSALVGIEPYRLLKRAFFAWAAPRTSVLVEIVPVENFPIRHLQIPPLTALSRPEDLA